MKELKIIENKIDWLQIIEMALKKKDWGKTYNLYVSEKVKITCIMNDFNFPKNLANFKIVCHYTYNDEIYNESDWNNYTFISYFNNNFTIEDFKNLVNRNIITLLKSIIYQETVKEAKQKFSDLKYTSYNIDLEGEAENLGYKYDLRTIKEINDNEIKNSCLYKFEFKIIEILNKEFEDSVNNYIANNKVEIVGINNILEKIEGG